MNKSILQPLWLRKLQELVAGPSRWDMELIRDEWFRAHFTYAADLVHEWLVPHLDLGRARLLNFGCGDGITDLALALRYGAASIHGVDIRQEYRKLPSIAREQLGMMRLPSALTFETIRAAEPLAKRHFGFDAVISWSTFEHVAREQLPIILADLCACLRPGGVFFLQIEPLFYSPWGSHLRRYIEEPWSHLHLDEAELWERVQQHQGQLAGNEVDFGFADFGPDGYKKFVFDEYRSLNQLTADELELLVKQAGFDVLRQERRQLDLPVPESLKNAYPLDQLLTNEVLLLLSKA